MFIREWSGLSVGDGLLYLWHPGLLCFTCGSSLFALLVGMVGYTLASSLVCVLEWSCFDVRVVWVAVGSGLAYARPWPASWLGIVRCTCGIVGCACGRGPRYCRERSCVCLGVV